MRRHNFPIFALFLGILAGAMLGPALFALLTAEWKAARSFFYAGLFTAFCAGMLGLALGRRSEASAQYELVVLISLWFVMPVFAALPLTLLTPQIGWIGAWFEMMAAFTTTGGTVYAAPESLPPPIHLWRGMVGWLGGFLTLMAAYVVMAPRRLGGFEVMASAEQAADEGTVGRLVSLGASTPSVGSRIDRAYRAILPIYAGMTMVLVLLFEALGKPALPAMVHAMSVISTSGISPYPTGIAASNSFVVELVAAVFLVLSATRLTYAKASPIGSTTPWHRDQELRMMALLVGLTGAALFMRHWFGVITTVETLDTSSESLGAMWGTIFTALSFLTTTGFESAFWNSARDWSGLASPGLILLGLCAVGGGAATTAGGIKLIRAFALMRHGWREVDRIAQPNGVVGVGSGLRGVLREGALIAWVSTMLFAIAVFVVMLSLSAMGELEFHEALIASLAALTNTGPAFLSALDGARDFTLLSEVERIILASAMVLGRIEMLGLIALFSPEMWRFSRTTPKTAGKSKLDTPNSRW